jgi:lipoprotein-anchoring transpeptidase ErfK/SrfK
VNESDETSSGSGRGRWWALAAALLAAVPAIPIVAGLIIGSSSVRAETLSGNTYIPVAPTPPVPASHLSKKPHESGSQVALLKRPTTMRTRPGGPRLAAIGTRTKFGSPQALWVVRQSGGWLGVISSDAGNGRVGWIARSAASLTRVSWELKVSLRDRRLAVLDNGKMLKEYSVAIGRPSAPTPTGHFSVTDRLETGDPSGPYGCCILAISARAPHAIQGWSGGDRIAIHSTPDASSIGQPVSHGCLRLTLAEGRWLMSHIPLGTPTIIQT